MQAPATLTKTISFPSTQTDFTLPGSAAQFDPSLGTLQEIDITHAGSITSDIKVENLVATSTSLANSYVGEFVGALRVGYWIQKEFELAVKAWFNVSVPP